MVVWFSRWISYSSNRKLNLLKVEYVNMHLLLRKNSSTHCHCRVSVATILSSRTVCPCSPCWFRKQQQVWSPQLLGPERVLRRGGERLSESTVLRSPALLHHPRPGQFRTRDHHCPQATQVHVLLLPLLSTRGEWNHFPTCSLCIHEITGFEMFAPSPHPLLFPLDVWVL